MKIECPTIRCHPLGPQYSPAGSQIPGLPSNQFSKSSSQVGLFSDAFDVIFVTYLCPSLQTPKIQKMAISARSHEADLAPTADGYCFGMARIFASRKGELGHSPFRGDGAEDDVRPRKQTLGDFSAPVHPVRNRGDLIRWPILPPRPSKQTDTGLTRADAVNHGISRR
jgi:hypothetical protein